MMTQKSYPYYLANQAVSAAAEYLEVTDKYTGAVVAEVSLAGATAVEAALGAAVRAATPMGQLKAYERQAILQDCLNRIECRAEELAQLLTVEVGKPIRDARGEVARTLEIFRRGAEESVRIYGEVIPLDLSVKSAGYSGLWKRVPIGPCAFITPFNFPLLLAAHKIVPALAVGCPFILKPAPTTPLTTLALAEILAETALPEGAFSILPCTNETAAPLIEDERIKMLSFTGSGTVGWMLKARAGKKRVALELGGNAGCIVDHDWDLDDAVARICLGGFYQSGQTCISVQRIIIHADCYPEFRGKLLAAVSNFVIGDPKQEATFIGPLISEREASRLEAWLGNARAAGAEILCGGKRAGLLFEPTVIENLPHDQALWCEEAFGPVVILESFTDFSAALKMINASRFGLQAGVFTRDLYRAERAFAQLEVGGVIIGDVPAWRVDHMPYGGVKDSGCGREGVRFAMEEMTERRLLVIRGMIDSAN